MRTTLPRRQRSPLATMRVTRARSAVLLGLALIVAAVGAAVAVDGGPLPGDVHGTRLVQAVGDPWYGPTARFFNGFMHDYGLPALALGSAAILAARRHVRAGALFLLWIPASMATGGLKQLIDRPRPAGDFAIREFPSTLSFPSGHAMAAVMVLGAWFVVAPHVLPRRAVLPARVAAAVGIAATALARVWAGAHWPSDVLASVAIGVVILATATMVLFRTYRVFPLTKA